MSKLLYISLFILLVLLLQVGYSYHFFYIEQFQLFMFSEDYLFETIFHPGGLSIYLGEFFVQFFYYPLVGEIITAFLLVCAAGLVKKSRSFNNTCFLPEGLILLFLLIDILDFNFLYAGIVAYLFCVIFLLAYQRIRKDIVRILTGCLMSCLLYLIAGSVFVVFAVSLLMLEINVYRIKKSMLLMPLVFMILLVFYLDHAGYLYYSEIICFADGIYALKGGAGWVIYAPWFLLAFSPFLSSYSDFIFSMIKNKYGKVGMQVVLLFLCGVFLLSEYDDRKSLPVKKYAYYAAHKKWEKILHSCKIQPPADLLCLNYQNLALAEQGILADSLLMYTQQGSKGLFVDWNMTPFVSMTLQQICYCYGDIASARKYAFECNVCARSVGYPLALKMLVVCNREEGECAVVDKYLSYLHKTWVYRDWEVDTLSLRPIESRVDNFVYRQNMDQLAYDNVYDKKLADFVLCSYLLDKNLNEFLKAFYYFYKNEKYIPVIYQEAILIGARSNLQILDYFSIPDALKERFLAYQSFCKANRSKISVSGKESRNVCYTKSYWYYYDFNPVRL
ncbi:DUF6057 family protein [Parabacteroides faecis]|uniref:DUF6057 family protein n=1 Tax=Parabacteroides faecis TaxID=1217282 RepID=UPI003A90BA39